MARDDAPRHVAEVVKSRAGEPGIGLVLLPGCCPDLNPIERPCDWLRDGVTRGHCPAGPDELRAARHATLIRANADPVAVVDRLRPEFELDPEYEAELSVPT